MVKKFSQYIFESISLELHFYSFDWDDNILHMPTVIHMDKKEDNDWIPVDVSTSEFAKVRNDKENYRLRDNDPSLAFSEFRDSGPRGDSAFLLDVKKALNEGLFGPSWDAFIKCLTEGAVFSIITARGHEPNTIRKAIEYIIDNVLTEEERFLLYSNCLKFSYIFGSQEDFDRIPRGQLSINPLIGLYLDSCDYYGVSSNSFASEFGESSASNPEVAKEMALERFIDKCNDFGKKVGAKSVSVGFSDDDPKNVEHVRTYFKEHSALQNELMPHKVKLNLYKTTDRELKGGERTKFSVTESSGSSIAPGMASSVMAFSQFNNMKDRMFTDPNEYDKSSELGTKQLAKMSKEYVKPKKKIKKKMKHLRKFDSITKNKEEKLKESHSETDNYMFFANLQNICNMVTDILEMDKSEIDQMLTEGHDWATDHISAAKESIEHVHDWLNSHSSKEEELHEEDPGFQSNVKGFEDFQ